jgi:hypothetical protein
MKKISQSMLDEGISLKYAKEIIVFSLTQLWQDPSQAHLLAPIMLWGPPGVGKSAIIKEICEEFEISLVDVRLSQKEPVDMRGLPVPDTQKNEVKWLISSEWPRDPNSKGIIFFDELSAADRSLQVAAYEMILDRKLGDLYKVPDGWLICAAGNRMEDQAVSVSISSALANRFCHLEVTADLNTWLNWAIETNIHPTVIAFLKNKPDALFKMTDLVQRGWPSPRSWARVSYLLYAYEKNKKQISQNAFNFMVHGLIGPGLGIEILAFYFQMQSEFDFEKILLGEVSVEIPKKLDLRYFFSTALSFYLWESKNLDKAIQTFLSIGCQMTSDFAISTLQSAIQKSKTTEASLKILQHPKMIEWQAKHGNFQAPPLKIKNAAQNGTQNGTQNDPNEASNQVLGNLTNRKTSRKSL